MQDWSEGYRTDIGYTYGYYTELNPLRARLAMLQAGYAYPKAQTACELGFGQGLSINVHDAGSATEWYGTDFNPSQVGFARELADGTPLAARLFDDAFDSFCRRPDLPEFDFIGLHGIWSWISDANRAVIADFIKRKLKVGGIVYVSYNTQPGWAAMAPLQELIRGHHESLGSPGVEIGGRIDAALDFAEKLLETGAVYGKANPIVAQQLKALRDHSHSYLAHEYFNRDWHPISFARMRECMSSLKLQFAGSAHFLDHVPVLHLSPEQQQLLASIPDPGFRETTRDFMVNQRFRRDYWVRGARTLSPLERTEKLRAQRVILASPADKVSLTVRGALGEARLHEDVYRPVLDTLADHGVRSIGEVEQAVRGRGVNLLQVAQAMMVLAGTGAVHPAQSEQEIEQARPRTDALNGKLRGVARHSGDVRYLASPVSGGALPVGRIDQLFLSARAAGLQAPGEQARYVNDILSAQGQQILREGKPIASQEEQLRELADQAAQMERERLPILRAFGVA